MEKCILIPLGWCMGWKFDVFNRDVASHFVFISTLFKLIKGLVLLLGVSLLRVGGFSVWVGVFCLGFFGIHNHKWLLKKWSH